MTRDAQTPFEEPPRVRIQIPRRKDDGLPDGHRGRVGISPSLVLQHLAVGQRRHWFPLVGLVGEGFLSFSRLVMPPRQ